jgi:ATP-dependent exoDNAse (exonuclease V) beta subunit
MRKFTSFLRVRCNIPHISYSEIKNWTECTWRHKLLYVDKIQVDRGNEHTAFGTAVHETIENMLLGKALDPYKYFNKIFTNELNKVGLGAGTELSKEMKTQVLGLFELVVPALDEYFLKKGGWTLVSTEEALKETITESKISGYDFKGFIDLVLKDGDGHYHIIDWKTCSWGWNARKKSDILFIRQLVLYKHFYARKLKINSRAISTHFGLLKRTSKKNRVELFRVTSGERKTKNSLDFMDRALYNISVKRYIKNRLSCKYCPFYETEHCT